MQAAFQRFAGTAEQAVPGQGGWRNAEPPYAKGSVRGGGVGRIIRPLRPLLLSRACYDSLCGGLSGTRVADGRRQIGLVHRYGRCVLVVMFGVLEGARVDVDGRPVPGNLLAISDLHIGYPGEPRPGREDAPRDRRRLAPRGRRRLGDRGRHPLGPGDPRRPLRQGRVGARQPRAVDPPQRTRSPLRGVARYEHLVALCRELGVRHPGGPVPRAGTAPAARSSSRRCSCCTTTPSCPQGCATKEEGLAYAHGTGVVCTDEYLLHPDPYPTREAWCRARVAETERRLAELPRRPADGARQPLPPGPASDGRPAATPSSPCGAAPPAPPTGTAVSASRPWSTAICTSRGPPGTTGVRFEEVSVGYPREWRQAPGSRRAGCAAFCRWRSGAGDRGTAAGHGGGRGGARP